MQSTRKSRATSTEAIRKIKKIGTINEYAISGNGLKILYVERKGTGVVTSNILYKVGARDEAYGETGIAHMLEHMLFKPTKHDIKRRTGSAAHLFETSVGAVLNATTWKDRTTYFFSYPKEHFETALKIEAERMRDVVLTNTEFLPEQTSVLSEYDMNAGDEEFLLSVPMAGAAFQSHPYGHETIGYREDIEGLTVEALNAFYKKFYAPNNAVLMIVGDIRESEMLACVTKQFAAIKPSASFVPRKKIQEPAQEGLRTVEVRHRSAKNILGIGAKHDGFPEKGWFETAVAFEILAGGKDSILYKRLVDGGHARAVHGSIEPTFDPNLGILFIHLGDDVDHNAMYDRVRGVLEALTIRDVAPYLKKVIARNLTKEFTGRENSLDFTAELIEYESAGAWEIFFDTEQILRCITAREVLNRIKRLFKEENLTLGKFISKK